MENPEEEQVESEIKNENQIIDSNTIINEKGKLGKEKISNKLISKEIICKKCKENCFLKINDYKFNLFGCKNDHNVKNILIENFEKTQKIQNTEKCEQCTKINNECYKCFTCNITICSKCKLKHDEKHNIIEKKKLNYICDKHYDLFTKYCQKCNKNICIECEKEHKDHETIYFGDILPNNNDKEDELKIYINKLDNEINNIINKLKKILQNIKLYYKINNNIINNYKNKNYQILININEFIKFNNIIIKDIQYIINANINNKFRYLMDIYEKMKNSNYILAEINIRDEDIKKEIRIINSFEEYFSKEKIKDIDDNEKSLYSNGKEIIKNCEIKINDEIIPFTYFYTFNEKGKYNIKYSFNHCLTKTNHLFYDCKNIIKLDFSNFKSKSITNIRCMFFHCESLKTINLSNFNTKNVTNMRGLFCGCKFITSIDLSNFNTENVTNMKNMFYGCKSLINLDLSNFNTQNVTNMSCMFSKCLSLDKLDLSFFNTKNVSDMEFMFYGCKSLTDLDLSNFNTQNATSMNSMFSECESLSKNKVITNDNNIIKQLENCSIY